MSEKKYLAILKIGVFLSLITLFLVFSNLLFPFVTSKQLIFNILIEVLLVFYFVFIIKFPKYRPTKSLVTFGLVGYFLAIALSLFVSVDFNLSFWGDLERMLGFFNLLHFLALYFIVISTFRSKKDYYLLFNAMLLACLVVAIGMIGSSSVKYSQSLLGNRAYLGAFMLFAIFLASLMISKSKLWWQKIIYIVSLPIFLYALVKADVSGSQAGLLVGIFFALLIFSFFNQNKKIKTIGVSVLLFFIILVSSLFYFRSNSIFDGTYLGRALRDFSSENVTLNTRLISWKAAGHYLLDHPVNLIFGVGHGNYALVFDKYFDASFYDYDRGATYFDRAHNNLVDITATTGVVGLITYLFFILILFYFLLKSYLHHRKNTDNLNSLGIFEFSILSGLLVAYFVQNLAVFDSFSTYMYLMFFAAYISFLELSKKPTPDLSKRKEIDIKENILLLVFSSVFLFLIFNINIKTINMSSLTIDAYAYLGQGKVNEARQGFEDAFELNSVLARDARESYINLFSSNFDYMLENNSMDDLEKIVVLAISSANANLNYNFNDSLMLYRAAKVYEMAGRFYSKKGDNEEAVKNNTVALQMIDFSIEASPQRAPLYSFKSNILLNFGKNQEAVETLNYAKNINSKMPDAFCQVVNLNFAFENFDNFFPDFESCVNNNGLKLMDFDSFVYRFEESFLKREDYNSVIKMYDIVLKKYPDDVDYLSRGGVAYYQSSEFSKARDCANRLLELDETYREDVELFLEQIDNKENK